jgi:hypothetical protein
VNVYGNILSTVTDVANYFLYHALAFLLLEETPERIRTRKWETTSTQEVIDDASFARASNICVEILLGVSYNRAVLGRNSTKI